MKGIIYDPASWSIPWAPAKEPEPKPAALPVDVSLDFSGGYTVAKSRMFVGSGNGTLGGGCSGIGGLGGSSSQSLQRAYQNEAFRDYPG